MGLGCSSGVECLPSKHEALALILSTTKTKTNIFKWEIELRHFSKDVMQKQVYDKMLSITNYQKKIKVKIIINYHLILGKIAIIKN
jgi:hypothetical protein